MRRLSQSLREDFSVKKPAGFSHLLENPELVATGDWCADGWADLAVRIYYSASNKCEKEYGLPLPLALPFVLEQGA